jgi:hypothetical protein
MTSNRGTVGDQGRKMYICIRYIVWSKLFPGSKIANDLKKQLAQTAFHDYLQNNYHRIGGRREDLILLSELQMASSLTEACWQAFRNSES